MFSARTHETTNEINFWRLPRCETASSQCAQAEGTAFQHVHMCPCLTVGERKKHQKNWYRESSGTTTEKPTPPPPPPPIKHDFDYRSISFTSSFWKTLENTPRKTILNRLSISNIFRDKQHSFLEGKSVLAQLMASFHDCIEVLNNGFQTDLVYIGFVNKFYSITHPEVLMN